MKYCVRTIFLYYIRHYSLRICVVFFSFYFAMIKVTHFLFYLLVMISGDIISRMSLYSQLSILPPGVLFVNLPKLDWHALLFLWTTLRRSDLNLRVLLSAFSGYNTSFTRIIPY